MTPNPARCLVVLLALAATAGADEPGRPGLVPFRVAAGRHDRRDSLVRFAIPAHRLGPEVVGALGRGPLAVAVVDPAAPPATPPTVAELDRRPDGSAEATWFLARPIPAGATARFVLDAGRVAPDAPRPWTVADGDGRAVEVRRDDRPVFRYNVATVAPPRPGMSPDLARSGYIHPAFTPTGALVTGDFSPSHPHQRGIFLAYVHARWGAAEPDFWNIQAGTGRIVADGVDPPRVGPVVARFAARHRWLARKLPPDAGGPAGEAVALRERWEVEAFAVPGTPYHLLDLSTTQQAEAHPLELLPYRYGGMAYRAAEPSVRGPIDVLTAEGRHRLDGDQRPTRWVDLTGPVAEGSLNYAGVMIADHPLNPAHPTVARIHPTTLPFFSFVPAHDRALTIAVDRPTIFRYRILIHDGRPDPSRDDRVAADFADPAAVALD